jgi:uncharacterized membrane protein
MAEVTQDERTYATLAHALQMAGWWIAPLVIFVVKRESKFVAFHALQVLFLQIFLLIFWFVGIGVWVAVIFGTVFKQGTPPPNAPPPGIFFLMPLLWLFFMGAWVFVLVLAIVYAIKAGRGEWAAYPVFGGLARRVLKI